MRKYDYVIVLCADKKNEKGEFPEFRDGCYIGADNKMNAALKFSFEHPEATYIICGGLDEFCGSSKKVEDMESFLIEGNPDIKIISIPSLSCIRHNFIAIFNKMGDELKNKRVGIIQSFIFTPRTLAIYAKLVEEEFEGMPILNVLCAESIVDNSDLVQNHLIEYLKKISKEQQGILDLENGTYIDYCLEKRNECFIEATIKYPYLTSQVEKEKYDLLRIKVKV